MFANSAVALGDHLVSWGQVLPFVHGILGAPPVLLGGDGNFVQLNLSVSN